MAFTAQDVKNLREQTGCGMMDCKKALTEAGGDFEKAVEYLREKGLAAAQKKAGRIAAEGMVYATVEGNVGVVLEVNAETDFVAKNEMFQTFVKDVAAVVIEQNPADVDALLACKMGSDTVEAALKDKILVIPGYLCESEVPAEVLDKEKEILLAQIANDPKNANKPDAIKEKMVMGRIGKFYKENCLVDQEFVKDPELTIAKYTDKVAKELGGDIKIVKFVRYEKGEGLEKRVDDFASEVAGMVK